MKWKKHTCEDLFLCLVLCWMGFQLLVHPREVSAAAASGLETCLQVLLPSLYPFMVLSSILIFSGAAGTLAKLPGRVMQRLFRLPESLSSAVLLGAVGGYPTGAAAVATLCQRRLCTRTQAEHAACFCCNAGPAFVIGALGGGLLHSLRAGVLLYTVHIVSAMFIGIALRKKREPASASGQIPQAEPFSEGFLRAVRESFSAFGNICAFVIFFAVFLQVIRLSAPYQVILAGYPAAEGLFCGMMELTSGVRLLAESGLPERVLYPSLSFLFGWSGISIQCQTVSLLRRADIPVRRFLLCRLLHGMTAALLSFMLC